MKILIAVPTFENIVPECFKHIYDVKKPCQVDFDSIKGYDCAKARNKIMQKAIDGNYDYVMMVDSDTLIPDETINYFLEVPVDICLGFCPHKNTKEGKTEIHKVGPKYGDKYIYSEIPDTPRINIRGGGAACIFINVKSVKEKLTYPYFKYVLYDTGENLSEDLFFCTKCREAGLTVQADTRVRCGHLARYFQYE